jgi:hypothetical protein
MSEEITKYEKSESLIIREYKALKVRNEADVFASPNKSLIRVTEDVGELGIRALLSYAIIDLIEFFNIGKPMTDVQIAQTIELIMDDDNLMRLKIDDFKLCFNRIKAGYYGQVYDRLDGQVILLWLTRYFNERLDIADNQSYSQHNEIKNTWADLSYNTEVRMKIEERKKEIEEFKLKANKKNNENI